VRRLQSILFYAFLVLSCFPLFAVALVIWAVSLPFDPNGRVLHLYSCGWAQLYFWVNPMWRLKIAGRENLPWHGPAVLVANHESLADILVLFGLYRPFKWVSKASVFKVPLIGWNMKLNRYVALVRGSRESVMKMLRDCETWLDRGVPVLLFPEGTRSPDGSVQPFKDGAFHLAIKKKVPVIPIVLAGTARTLPKHGFVLREHADCRVQVLKAIPVSELGENTQALKELVRGRIIAEKERLQPGSTPQVAPAARESDEVEPPLSHRPRSQPRSHA
jgi:1-acyl-sn-glycerol-3-phosphate acyltransferase